jgi:hypothetical protein
MQDDAERLRGEGAARLWEYNLSEQSMFIQRQNYFMVMQSLFVVAFASLVGSQSSAASPSGASSPVHLVIKLLALFGVILSLVWIVISRTHYRMMLHVWHRSIEAFPEYRQTIESYPRRVRLTANWIMAYLVPAILAAMWATFFVVV